ncbi:MAG TPA: hypothetical protein VFI02_06285 [Armatimonadota bacterium]|nr:hypothetical protein [Armatimonadota bacterium]
MSLERTRISAAELAKLRGELDPLIGTQFSSILSLPVKALQAFEPSQVGTIVGSLMDALLPYLESIPQVGLTKHEGLIGEREGYPDYRHASGFRLELKLLYKDNPDLEMKRPPTRREPSARVTQKVTVKNVNPALDAMLLIAYQLQPQVNDPDCVSPTIIDLEVLSMIELVEARDKRMVECGGRWFGNYETPTILSNAGRRNLNRGQPLDIDSYGRKESEGKDFSEDTNFGKLKRIPHPVLQAFLRKHHFIVNEQSECQI